MDKSFIADWKRQYGDVYSIVLGKVEYFYRSLTIGEVDDIRTGIDAEDSSADVEDRYVSTAVIYPGDLNINKMKPGHVTKLAEEIMRISGLSDTQFLITTLDEARENATLITQMKAFVITAMPILSEEYFADLTIKQLIGKVVLSEEILSIQQDVNGMQTTGVKFLFTSGEEQEQGPAPKMKGPKIPGYETMPTKPESKKLPDREELLKRIRKSEKETTNFDKLMSTDQSALSLFEDVDLARAVGIAADNDPIAAKLKQALGG